MPEEPEKTTEPVVNPTKEQITNFKDGDRWTQDGVNYVKRSKLKEDSITSIEPKTRVPKEKKFSASLKVKDIPERPPQEKPKSNINAEQLDMLISPAVNFACSIMNKEELENGRTKNFSAALYEVGKMNGWWDKIEFFPYLVLIGAGIDLSMAVIASPTKAGKEKVVETNKELLPQANISTKEPNAALVDIIDDKSLINKIMGVKK